MAAPSRLRHLPRGAWTAGQTADLHPPPCRERIRRVRRRGAQGATRRPHVAGNVPARGPVSRSRAFLV